MKAKRAAATGPVDGLWTLPDGWRWERLETIADVNAGQSPPSAIVNKQGHGLPFYQGKADFGRDTPTARNWCETPTKRAASGDILISVRAPVGPTNYATETCGIGRGLAAIRTHAVSSRWLRYWLTATADKLRARATGTTFEAITGDVLRSHLCPIPPKGLDESMVARIDELFAEIDDGDAALGQARKDLGTWRKALLRAAVTGELTADWRTANPPFETSSKLAGRIIADRANVATKRLGKRRDRAPDEVTAAQQLLMWSAPEGWTWIQLGHFSFVTKLAGFEYTKFIRYDDAGDLRVIKAENAGLHGFKETNYSRIKSASVRELTRSRLHGGELLMVFVGAGTGNVAIVPPDEDFFLGPNIGMMRVETDVVSPRYVELFLRSPVGKALATAAMKAVAQPSLSMGTIRQIPVLIPPAAEQNEVLCRLEQALMATANCETVVRDQKTHAFELRQSILAAAFRGELA